MAFVSQVYSESLTSQALEAGSLILDVTGITDIVCVARRAVRGDTTPCSLARKLLTVTIWYRSMSTCKAKYR